MSPACPRASHVAKNPSSGSAAAGAIPQTSKPSSSALAFTRAASSIDSILRGVRFAERPGSRTWTVESAARGFSRPRPVEREASAGCGCSARLQPSGSRGRTMYRSGSDRLDLLRHDFEQLLDELTGEPVRRARALHDEDTQAVPINMFETDTELVIVAAMPGIEAANVDVQIDDTRLTLRGDKRGPGQDRQRYLAREWTYGSYERTIDLPPGIDLDRANATYGNGVVTIAFPKLETRRRRRIEIRTEGAKAADRSRSAADGQRRATSWRSTYGRMPPCAERRQLLRRVDARHGRELVGRARRPRARTGRRRARGVEPVAMPRDVELLAAGQAERRGRLARPRTAAAARPCSPGCCGGCARSSRRSPRARRAAASPSPPSRATIRSRTPCRR